MTEAEFEQILADESKAVEGDLRWIPDEDHSPSLEFKERIICESGHPKVHGPCPDCGGTDRFRAFDDVNDSGGLLCNQCGKRSDVFADLILASCTATLTGRWLAEFTSMRGKGRLRELDMRSRPNS